jgi:hypothetical protein
MLQLTVQSVSMSWCQVHSGTRDQMLYSVWKLLCCLCGAPSLMRGRVCVLSVSHPSVFGPLSKIEYSLHCTCHMFYVYAIYTRPLSAQAQYSRSCQNLRYNSNLDAWTVVRQLLLITQPLHGPHRKHHFQHFFHCCMTKLPRDGSSTATYLRSCCLAMAVVFFLVSWSLPSNGCICHNTLNLQLTRDCTEMVLTNFFFA